VSTDFRTKRIYEKPAKEDGYRVLVDRLWPRGMSKAVARVDLWAKDMTPSTELRKWFHANPDNYDEFVKKYQHELNTRRAEIEQLVEAMSQPTVTLLTAVKNPDRSHVPVLKKFLTELVSNR